MAFDSRSEIYEILDERFLIPANGDMRLELLYDGARWSEGPLYVPAWRQVIFSDVSNDRILRWDEPTGTIGVFRTPSGNSNGNTLDREGRLITCEQGNRRVTRTEHDGSVTVIADRFAGKRFNSPNDVVVHSDGSIWFSDPIFGILSDYEGNRGESEIGASNVYRVDPKTGKARVMADGFLTPNGLCFSLDESQFYVADTVAGQIRVYDLCDDGKPSEGKIFAEAPLEKCQFDSVHFDDEGRLWVAAGGGGLHCYAPDGTLIGRIIIPRTASNFAFGGPKNNRLFITAGPSVYSLVVAVTGAPRIGGTSAQAKAAAPQAVTAYATKWRMNAGGTGR
ncbi:SMP-30/gluconolactonase/LRE family protein [Streptomyces zagrosensis]|uniref:Gluconolactonase n=1 Tax=Streptomyces zagrosensis TaxID=1042984 RepID=A0A7W9UZ57_9ACTN|nr:SMP-30/gluconolactonase/LRE family protein [Streptomyces zagrosensis]MBB5936675.1 gluconolactonase [Streptomyces zagrosensis]